MHNVNCNDMNDNINADQRTHNSDNIENDTKNDIANHSMQNYKNTIILFRVIMIMLIDIQF